ncbi:MAG: CRTAC1 family protein [Planctomycetota bacterium]
MWRTPIAILAALVMLSCSDSPSNEPKTESLSRMERELSQIAAEADTVNPYFERQSLVDLENELAALPEGVKGRRRWGGLFQLGTHELRLGEFESAVTHLEQAAAICDRRLPNIRPNEIFMTKFRLAVACLRLGEVQNCIARHTSESCIFPIGGSGVHVDQRGSRRAMEILLAMLEAQPDSRPLQWLFNLAAMTVGEWPDGVPERYRLPEAVVRSGAEWPRFVDVASRLGINNDSLSGGAIVEDIDGDGDLDILTSSIDPRVPLCYWRNDEGQFHQARKEAGLEKTLGGLNLIQGDYDGDGRIDVLVLRGAWWGEQGRHPNSLLKNEGGRFRDVTFEAGIAEPRVPTQTASFADYDLDGDLDLYVGAESNEAHPFAGQLFRNRGDGTFEEVATEAGVTNDRYAKSAVFGDFDGDRWPDLYISNLHAPNRLYRNLGDGRFEDVAPTLGVTEPIHSFPSWFFDANQDGRLDIFVSEYRTDLDTYVRAFLGEPGPAELNRLYLSSEEGGFRSAGTSFGLNRMTVSMGANFGDLDGDGYPDFYLGTGYPEYEALMPNVMYHNVNGQRFEEITIEGGFGHLQKGHAIAFADIDQDGDQDVFAQMGGAYPGDTFGDALFENPGFRNRFLKVSLVGRRSNRFGIGCRLRVDVIESGEPRTVWSWLNSGGTFGARPISRHEIGLGQAESIERLVIDWPATGEAQVFEDVTLDSWVRVIEGEAELEVLPLKPLELRR